MNKIYSEVTSGGMFSSLTQGIRGIFGGRRAATSSNVDGQGSVNTAATTSYSSSVTSTSSRNTAPTANSVAIRSFASFQNFGKGSSIDHQLNHLMGIQWEFQQLRRNTERPESFRKAKTLLTKIRRSCECEQREDAFPYDYNVNRLLQNIVLPFLRGFRQQVKRDQGVKNDLRFLRDWLSKRIPHLHKSLDWDFGNSAF